MYFLVTAKVEIVTVTSFVQAITQRGWQVSFCPVGQNEVGDDSLKKFLLQVSHDRPDVVVLDAALNKKEEKLLDELELEGVEVTEQSLSGFLYCKILSSEGLGVPIVFLTKNAHGQVARIAMRVGADRVLQKTDKSESLIREIVELVKLKTPHDSAFYWPMRSNFSGNNKMWQSEYMLKALDRFYLNESSVRRFGLFTASLKGVLSTLFQGKDDAEKRLMLSLVKSQVLLSLVDPKLRDHVRHTGNIFWIGYRLIHELYEFETPESLPGYIPVLYGSGTDLPRKEQLLFAWTLASLFHDYGYVDERQDQLASLVKSLLPRLSLSQEEVRDETSWVPNMTLLGEFAEKVLGEGHFLTHFLNEAVKKFGTVHNNNKLIDHGLISAHRLLDLLPLKDLDPNTTNIVMHAALAIAYHNYSDIVVKWKLSDKCKGRLNIGQLPVCSLLAFCDNVQTWDRESDIDPALPRAELFDGLLERLVLSDTSYVSGSEITEFNAERKIDGSGYDIQIKLRYFVEAAGGVEQICESLGHDIKRWIDSGRLKEVCDATGISSLLHGELLYELPMLAGTKRASF